MLHIHTMTTDCCTDSHLCSSCLHSSTDSFTICLRFDLPAHPVACDLLRELPECEAWGITDVFPGEAIGFRTARVSLIRI